MALLILGLCLLASCAYSLLSLYCAHCWQRAARESPSGNAREPITLLKPLRGGDPEQYANFASFCHQEYPEYQIVFGALDPADPGLETARRLCREFPDRDIAIVAGGEAFGLNRKVCNLHHMMQAAKHDLLVLCDSDMRVQPDYLRRVAAPFHDPAVGLVTCLYRGHRAQCLASMLEALGIGADFAPSVLVANRLEGMSFAFGSTIALRRETLEAIGGFRALADELADDYRMGNRVRKQEKRVVLSDYVVDNMLGRETFGAMWARRLRWAKTMRAMRPAGYAGAILTHTTAMALLFLLASRFQPVGWLGIGTALLIRGAVAVGIARRYTQDENLPRRLWLLPFSDLLSFGLWAASFRGKDIVWRGERFRLDSEGRLLAAEARPRRDAAPQDRDILTGGR